MKLITNAWFKQVDATGLENVNQNKGIILIANHNNQFIDGNVLISSLNFSQFKMVAAAKALDFPVVKQTLDALGVVKVNRPQDSVSWRTDVKIKQYSNSECDGEIRLILKLDKKITDIEKDK